MRRNHVGSASGKEGPGDTAQLLVVSAGERCDQLVEVEGQLVFGTEGIWLACRRRRLVYVSEAGVNARPKVPGRRELMEELIATALILHQPRG